MYKKFLVLHHLIQQKEYVAYFFGQILQFADQVFVNYRPTNNQRNFCNIKFLHLVCEDNSYTLLVQRNYFQKQYAANLQEEVNTEMRFQKKLRSTSAWVLYCKFAADLRNTLLDEHLWGTAFLLYIICFGGNNKKHVLLTSFQDLQTRICRLIRNYLKVLFILSYIFQNNFPIACCN